MRPNTSDIIGQPELLVSYISGFITLLVRLNAQEDIDFFTQLWDSA